MLTSSQRFWTPRLVGPEVGNLVVADPDESMFSMVRQLTAPDEWRVSYAATPVDVMRMLRSGGVRLAVIELAMLDASPALAEDVVSRSRRGLRVIVTTDDHSEANERRARTLGPVFYAPKPLNITLLNHVLQGALRAAV